VSPAATILIPTFNRYPYLRRVLAFYRSRRFPYPVLILDSSQQRLPGYVRGLLEGNSSVKYIRFPEKTPFAEKLARGLALVHSGYSLFCADDDFVLPSGVSASIEFLEQNGDYSSCQGITITHSATPSRLASRRFRWNPSPEDAKSIEFENPALRLHGHLSKYTLPTFYAVHRTPLARLIWNETCKYTSDWGLSELFPSAMSVIYGKMKLLPVLYSSRERNLQSWATRQRLECMYSAERCQIAASGLALHLAVVTGEKDRAFRLAWEAISSYRSHVLPNAGGSRNKIVTSCLHLPWIKVFGRTLLRFQRHVRSSLLSSRKRPDVLKALENSGADEELETIRQHVLSSSIHCEHLHSSRDLYRTSSSPALAGQSFPANVKTD